MTKIYTLADLNAGQQRYRMRYLATGGSEDVMDFLEQFEGDFRDSIDFVYQEIMMSEDPEKWDGPLTREAIREAYGDDPLAHPRWSRFFFGVTDNHAGRLLVFNRF